MKFPSEETARSIEGRALGKDQDFWSRNDLIYLGDLNWTGQSNPEGYEYITTPMRSGEYFIYIRHDYVIRRSSRKRTGMQH